MCVIVSVRVRVCACVCVCERERERESARFFFSGTDDSLNRIASGRGQLTSSGSQDPPASRDALANRKEEALSWDRMEDFGQMILQKEFLSWVPYLY